MNETIFNAAAIILPLIFAVVFHEVSHGLAARALGDPTAAERNRLSLNPLRHVDPMGTIIVPGMLKLAGWPVFGWAKPVPVDQTRLRNPRRDMMLVAVAGPVSNFVMAGIGAVALGLMLRAFGPGEGGLVAGFIGLNLLNFIMINIFLGLFNLLPVPPFDGGHVIEGLLPRSVAARFRSLGRYILLVMILLIVVLPMISPQLNVVGRAVGPAADWVNWRYMDVVKAIAGR